MWSDVDCNRPGEQKAHVERGGNGFRNKALNGDRIHVWYVSLHLVGFYGKCTVGK